MNCNKGYDTISETKLLEKMIHIFQTLKSKVKKNCHKK